MIFASSHCKSTQRESQMLVYDVSKTPMAIMFFCCHLNLIYQEFFSVLIAFISVSFICGKDCTLFQSLLISLLRTVPSPSSHMGCRAHDLMKHGTASRNDELCVTELISLDQLTSVQLKHWSFVSFANILLKVCLHIASTSSEPFLTNVQLILWLYLISVNFPTKFL